MATFLSASAACTTGYGKQQPLDRQRRIACRFSFLNATLPRSASPIERLLSLHRRDDAVLSRLVVAALPDDLSSTAILSTAIATLLSFSGFRVYVYFRMQYIIAAMLGKYVPRGGCTVLDMDIHEGRNLYYYPSDVAKVVAVSVEKNRGTVMNQAIRAGIPVDLKVKALNMLSLPSSSMDAVVSVYCFCGLQERETKRILQEAIRLLKPGKPFIFVENVVAEGDFLRTCQALLQKVLQLFGIKTALPKDLSKVFEEAEGLEKLEYDTVFGFQDPHIVGFAMKQMQAASSTSKKKGNKKSVSM